MTLADGTLGRNEGEVYPANALLLKAQLHSQLIRAAPDVIKFFSVNPSVFSIIVAGLRLYARVIQAEEG
jgi:hypothetical protein